MIRIYLGGEKITYTAGDFFLINVTCAECFENGSQLKLQIAENEQGEYIINKAFTLSDSYFKVSLDEEEKEKLAIGEYIYKLVLINSDGNIITRKSGDFIVKWGA